MAATIEDKTPMDEILQEIIYTRARLLMLPITAALVAGFDDLYTLWGSTHEQELTLLVAVENTEATVEARDDDLDDYVDTVVSALLLANGQDRNHPLYVLLMGGKQPAELKKPILSDQLAQMKTVWPGALSGSDFPTVKALAPLLTPLTAAADAAWAAYVKAQADLEAFRAVGGQKALIDKVNSTRQLTAGQLKQIRFDNAALSLPSDFAARYFKVDSRGGKASPSALKRKLDAQKNQLGRTQKQLDALTAKAQEKTQKATARAAVATELDKAKKSRDDATTKVKDLQSQLDKLT